jgi:D-alanyl-D-alanine carboxypeptidase
LPSSTHRARTALLVVAAALAAGPLSVGRSTGDLTSADAAPPAEQAETVDVGVDPASAAPDDVVTALGRLDQAVARRTAAVTSAKEAAAAAADKTEQTQKAQKMDGPSRSGGVTAQLGRLLPGRGLAASALEPSAVAAARQELAAAEAAADDAAAALEAARAAQDRFVASAEERVTDDLADAEAVARRDRRHAHALRSEAQEIATTLERVTADERKGTPHARREDAASRAGAAARPPAAPAAPAPAPPPAPVLPDPAGSASGALATPWCSNGQYIVVDASLGASVQALLNEAHRWGVELCATSGFRSYAEQVGLRQQNCGTSDFAVFQAPPSTCSPPTARPGTSNHEDGLAIDFNCGDGQPMTHASPCYQWLALHAHWYGLRNLPSEPWHWSVTGR